MEPQSLSSPTTPAPLVPRKVEVEVVVVLGIALVGLGVGGAARASLA